MVEAIDNKTMIVEANARDHEFQGRLWIMGFPTSTVADGSKVSLECPVEIVGTKSYKNSQGEKLMIPVAKPFMILPSEKAH